MAAQILAALAAYTTVALLFRAAAARSCLITPVQPVGEVQSFQNPISHYGT
jgi:hypothetical protein